MKTYKQTFIMHKGLKRHVYVMEQKLDKIKVRILDSGGAPLYGMGHKDSTDWINQTDLILE